jgi:hypothetical protein
MAKLGAQQIGESQVRLNEAGTLQVGQQQVCRVQNGVIENGKAEIGIGEICPFQMGAGKVCTAPRFIARPQPFAMILKGFLQLEACGWFGLSGLRCFRDGRFLLLRFQFLCSQKARLEQDSLRREPARLERKFSVGRCCMAQRNCKMPGVGWVTRQKGLWQSCPGGQYKGSPFS